jgi:hypothetical protein
MQCGCAVWVCGVGVRCGCAVWVCGVGVRCGCAVWMYCVGVQCGVSSHWCLLMCSGMRERARPCAGVSSFDQDRALKVTPLLLREHLGVARYRSSHSKIPSSISSSNIIRAGSMGADEPRDCNAARSRGWVWILGYVGGGYVRKQYARL